MKYQDVERRLAALEAAQQPPEPDAGKAPEIWPRLAQWAIAVHAAGGLEAATAIFARGDRLPLDCPYQGNDTHPHVYASSGDLQFFWRAGTMVWPTREQQGQMVWWIVEYVTYLLEQGMTHAEIKSWETGRAVWDAIQHEIKGESR